MSGSSLSEILANARKSISNSLDEFDARWSKIAYDIGSRVPRGITVGGGLVIGGTELILGLNAAKQVLYAPESLSPPLRVGAAIIGTLAIPLTTFTVETMFMMDDARRQARISQAEEK